MAVLLVLVRSLGYCLMWPYDPLNADSRLYYWACRWSSYLYRGKWCWLGCYCVPLPSANMPRPVFALRVPLHRATTAYRCLSSWVWLLRSLSSGVGCLGCLCSLVLAVRPVLLRLSAAGSISSWFSCCWLSRPTPLRYALTVAPLGFGLLSFSPLLSSYSASLTTVH